VRTDADNNTADLSTGHRFAARTLLGRNGKRREIAAASGVGLCLVCWSRRATLQLRSDCASLVRLNSFGTRPSSTAHSRDREGHRSNRAYRTFASTRRRCESSKLAALPSPLPYARNARKYTVAALSRGDINMYTGSPSYELSTGYTFTSAHGRAAAAAAAVAARRDTGSWECFSLHI